MPDSEKITINLGLVDLGKIDLLVEESFYGNRADFIRTAIRNLLDSHQDVVKQVTIRRQFTLGVMVYDRKELERARASGEMFDIRIIGADWKGKEYTGHDLPIEMYFNSREHSFSTSALRERIYEAELKKREETA